MSYPNGYQHYNKDKLYITFTVPNQQIINKIAQDALTSKRLYTTTLARSLSTNISELATIFREYDLTTSPIEEERELRVRIIMPDLPAHQDLSAKQMREERRPSRDYEVAPKRLKELSRHDRTTMYRRSPPLTTIWEEDEEDEGK
jgi:hypothetical protein